MKSNLLQNKYFNSVQKVSVIIFYSTMLKVAKIHFFHLTESHSSNFLKIWKEGGKINKTGKYCKKLVMNNSYSHIYFL